MQSNRFITIKNENTDNLTYFIKDLICAWRYSFKVVPRSNIIAMPCVVYVDADNFRDAIKRVRGSGMFHKGDFSLRRFGFDLRY